MIIPDAENRVDMVKIDGSYAWRIDGVLDLSSAYEAVDEAAASIELCSAEVEVIKAHLAFAANCG